MARLSCNCYSKSLYRRVDFDLVIPSLGLHASMDSKNPREYRDNGKKFPLIIFLSGFGEDQKSWTHFTSIEEELEARGIAGVFLNGENKFYINAGPLDNFYDFIEKDLPDYLYGTFANLDEHKPLLIWGNSMGGYGALYHYLHNLDKYAAAVALSPATKPDSFPVKEGDSIEELLIQSKDKNPKVYLSVGDKDFIFDSSLKLDQRLKEAGVPVSYRIKEGFYHNWDFWKREVKEIFEYLKSQNII